MIAYIFKSSLSLIMLFGLYWFLLRKEKLFEFNRYFLIISVVFSLVVPFISIPVNFQITPQLNEVIPVYNYAIPEISITENTAQGEANTGQPIAVNTPSVISISAILLALYFTGAIFFLIRFLSNIFIIIRRTKISEKTRFKGYRIVLTDDDTNPCCFLNNIYLNRDDYLNDRIDKELLDHELEHAKQSHTVDIILIELVKIFYWFNPVYVLYDRAIRINHEYLADDGAIGDKSDIKNYADKMLSFITCRSNFSLISGSNHSLTKKRIIMIMKPGSGRLIYGARIGMAMFIGTAILVLLSFKQSDYRSSHLNSSETGITQSVVRGIILNEEGKPLTENTKIVYETAEKMPEYPGGAMELRKFIATNLNYPQSVASQKAEGVVIVRFVVNTEGKIENVEILKRVHPALDVEVLRVVGMLDRFIPGSQGGKPVNVYYTLPVTFALPKSNPSK